MDLTDFTRDQHGLITREQLVSCGHGEDAIEWLLRSGQLTRKHRGVYVLPGLAGTWAQRAMAALLRCGPQAALSHLSAAQAHELEGLEFSSKITLVVPEKHRVRAEDLTVHRTREALPVTISNGLRVTSLARTFVDLAETVTPAELEKALDHAVRRRQEVKWLLRYLEKLNQPSRRGLALLRRLAELRRDGATDSSLEVDVWSVLRARAVPPCKKQHPVWNGREYVMRIDFAWPEQKVALHADSLRHHQTPREMARDARQRATLQELGWRQLVVVKPMLTETQWVDQLKRLLAPPLK